MFDRLLVEAYMVIFIFFYEKKDMYIDYLHFFFQFFLYNSQVTQNHKTSHSQFIALSYNVDFFCRRVRSVFNQ